jgi:hypothetical protein
MAERNYPCDNLIIDYFGNGSTARGNLDNTGDQAFKQQLWQCMIAQALAMQSDIETRRSSINTFGIMTWQLNEIWPTGGWGSLEYGTVGFTKGQVLGGRWRPLHHFMEQHLFTDVFATCGAEGQCIVKNDDPLQTFKGVVKIMQIKLEDGFTSEFINHEVSLPVGPGTATYFMGPNISSNGEIIYECIVSRSDGEVLSSHVILPTAPYALKLPKSNVTATVSSQANLDGSINVHIEGTAAALYVTLTSLAQGRFSENAFLLADSGSQEFGSKFVKEVSFIPFGQLELKLLQNTLRVEHMALYM